LGADRAPSRAKPILEPFFFFFFLSPWRWLNHPQGQGVASATQTGGVGWSKPPPMFKQWGGRPPQKNLQIFSRFFIIIFLNKSNILLLLF
jgi:hypothetical protein